MVNFIDNSTSVVGTNSPEALSSYLNKFKKLVEHFYAINGLIINSLKIKFNVNKNPDKNERKFELVTTLKDNLDIKDNQAIKVLGIWINCKGTHDLHLRKE